MGVDVVLGGSASAYLAKKVAESLDAEFVALETRKFPDGETYVRIPADVAGKKVALVQSMYRSPNEYLAEFLLAARTLKDLGASEIVAVIPYLPYMRQDSRFKPGEALSARIVAELMEWCEISTLVTVDLHLHRYKSPSELFRVRVRNLTAAGELARAAVSEFGLEAPLIVGPDEEAEQWARVAAEAVGAKYIVLRKERSGDEEVRVTGAADAADRDVLIVDDIVSTGGTLAEAARLLKAAGARRVYAACTHALLVSGAEAKLYAAGINALIATDSVPNPYAIVSVAPLVAEALREV